MTSWRPAEEKGSRVHGDGVQPSDLTGCACFWRHTRPHVGDAKGASAEAAARERFPDTNRAHLAFNMIFMVEKIVFLIAAYERGSTKNGVQRQHSEK